LYDLDGQASDARCWLALVGIEASGKTGAPRRVGGDCACGRDFYLVDLYSAAPCNDGVALLQQAADLSRVSGAVLYLSANLWVVVAEICGDLRNGWDALPRLSDSACAHQCRDDIRGHADVSSAAIDDKI
jgi:hypothetical protein